VNLSKEKLAKVKQCVDSNTRIIILALTPGDPSSAAAASGLSTGETVITLWFSNGQFNHQANTNSYQLMRKLITG
jgi:hypothetical protein